MYLLFNFTNIFCENLPLSLCASMVVNDQNHNFGRYQNFGNFGIGRNTTDTERCSISIPKPIPKPIPKDEKISLLKVFNLALHLKFN